MVNAIRVLRLLLSTVVISLPIASSEDGSGLGGITFRNLSDRTLMLYWVSFDGSYRHQGQIHGDGGMSGFQTYPGHSFIWAEMGPDGRPPQNPIPIEQVTISEDQLIYAFSDHTTKPSVLEALNREVAFRERYFAENGKHWVGTTWPRPPVTLGKVRASRIGEIIEVAVDSSNARWYLCDEASRVSGDEGVTKCLQSDGVSPDPNMVRREGPSFITLEVVSLEPRVFLVRGFLSSFEADYIIQQTRPLLRRSTTGNGVNAKVDPTRTSQSAWLTRSHSDVMDAIYRRVAIATAIPEELLWENQNVESLNVLNYPTGGEYSPHYDVGANNEAHSRYISGLLYLNDVVRGGATSFPKARMAGGRVGTFVPARKGSFCFFYDLLEDGNVDVLSLHSGSKWRIATSTHSTGGCLCPDTCAVTMTATMQFCPASLSLSGEYGLTYLLTSVDFYAPIHSPHSTRGTRREVDCAPMDLGTVANRETACTRRSL